MEEQKLEIIRTIVNQINSESKYAGEETYELDRNNMIIGCSIRLDDLELCLYKNQIYVEDATTGDTACIDFTEDSNVYEVLSFLKKNDINVRFNELKVSSIGEFYKPTNRSKLTYIDKVADLDMLCYLLEFLQSKGTLNLIADYTDGFENVIGEWNNLPEV